MVASGGEDFTIWLLFGFVVRVLFIKKIKLHFRTPYPNVELKMEKGEQSSVGCLQVVNLAFAAAETHRWYFRKFDNYPRNRFAIIPYVY